MVAHSREQGHNNLAENTLAASNAIHSVCLPRAKLYRLDFCTRCQNLKTARRLSAFFVKREEKEKCFILNCKEEEEVVVAGVVVVVIALHIMGKKRVPCCLGSCSQLGKQNL